MTTFLTNQLASLLAAMTLGEKLLDALTVTIVGMGTVFVSLWLIGEVFALLQRFFERSEGGRTEEADAAASKSAQAAANSGAKSEIDAHLVPILVAAATAVAGRRVVLRRIRFINRNTISGWAEAGRAEIQSSHNIRRKM